MTLTTINGTRYSDDEARPAAQLAYRDSLRAGTPLTGDQLGARFPRADTGAARSPEWGRKMIRAARTTPVPVADTGTGSGTATGGPAPAPSRQRTTVPNRSRHAAAPEPAPDLLDQWGRLVVGGFITALALLISYSHMRHLAELAGVSWPQLAPLLIDGLLATALLCLRRHSRYWAARLALVLSVVAALALNALAERPELVELEDVRLWWALMVPATAAFGVHLVAKR